MTIINVLIILWTIIMIPISQRIYHRLLNPCFLICAIWCVSSSLSTTGAFSFTIPSLKTDIYIFVFLLAFSLSLCFFHLAFAKIRNRWNEKSIRYNCTSFSAKNEEITVNVKLFSLLLVCFIIFMSPTIVKSIGYIVSGNFFTLRELILRDSATYMGRFAMFFYNYIIRSYIIFLNILAAYAFGKGHRQKWSLLALALVGSSIHMVLTVGRMLYFELLCYVLLAIFLYRPKESDTIARFSFLKLHANISKRGVIFFVTSIPLVIGIIFMTVNRMNSTLGVIGSFWQYSISPMSYLNIIVNNPKLFGLNSGNFLLGQATFGPISGIFETIQATFLGTSYQGPDQLLNLYSEVYYRVAPGVRVNAMSTIIYPFLRDWGIAGLVIGPILVSLFVTFVYHKTEFNKESVGWNLALISIYYMLLFSIWRYTLLYPWTYMSFLWILAFQYFNRINIRFIFRKKSRIDNISSKSSATLSVKLTR